MPIVCVGNLSVGGTGKSPMIEYLLNYLIKKYNVATLSRGYKRQSSGFILADNTVSVEKLGDEPFQFYKKFESKAHVAVDENRRRGIETLITKVNPDVILLDDAFQHRKVKAGLNILLTTYNKLYVDDFLLPTGNLRESSSGAKRANIIVVTKCPENLSVEEKTTIQSKLRLNPTQELFFSTIDYDNKVYNDNSTVELKSFQNKKFTLVTGIANPKPLVAFLKKSKFDFEHITFSDHHIFSETEKENLRTKDFILTTEKDYMRLEGDKQLKDKLFYLPISFEISEAEKFHKSISDFITT